VCERFIIGANAAEAAARAGADGRSGTGTQIACFTGTNVQVLTQKAAQTRPGEAHGLRVRALKSTRILFVTDVRCIRLLGSCPHAFFIYVQTYADVC
jgi:hypothetical protein